MCEQYYYQLRAIDRNGKDEGFSGLLAREPNNGDRLFVRYADEKEFSMGVVYGSVPIV